MDARVVLVSAYFKGVYDGAKVAAVVLVGGTIAVKYFRKNYKIVKKEAQE